MSEKTPIVEEAEKYINTYQGNFINYIDGKGNDNTDEKTDHKAVIGEKTTMMPQNNQGNTQYVDVQKSGSGLRLAADRRSNRRSYVFQT